MARCLIVLAAVALVAGSCADDPSLDEDSLLEGLPAALIPDAPEAVADLSCPVPEEATVARTSVCTAEIHGEPIAIDLEVDEEGSVAATVRERLVDLAEVESVLEARLRDELAAASTGEVSVECPGTVVVDRPGVEVRCTGTSGGRALGLLVEIGDDSGWTVSFAPDADDAAESGRGTVGTP